MNNRRAPFWGRGGGERERITWKFVLAFEMGTLTRSVHVRIVVGLDHAPQIFNFQARTTVPSADMHVRVRAHHDDTPASIFVIISKMLVEF